MIQKRFETRVFRKLPEIEYLFPHVKEYILKKQQRESRLLKEALQKHEKKMELQAAAALFARKTPWTLYPSLTREEPIPAPPPLPKKSRTFAPLSFSPLKSRVRDLHASPAMEDSHPLHAFANHYRAATGGGGGGGSRYSDSSSPKSSFPLHGFTGAGYVAAPKIKPVVEQDHLHREAPKKHRMEDTGGLSYAPAVRFEERETLPLLAKNFAASLPHEEEDKRKESLAYLKNLDQKISNPLKEMADSYQPEKNKFPEIKMGNYANPLLQEEDEKQGKGRLNFSETRPSNPLKELIIDDLSQPKDPLLKANYSTSLLPDENDDREKYLSFLKNLDSKTDSHDPEQEKVIPPPTMDTDIIIKTSNMEKSEATIRGELQTVYQYYKHHYPQSVFGKLSQEKELDMLETAIALVKNGKIVDNGEALKKALEYMNYS